MCDKFKIGASVWPGLSKLIEEAGEIGQVAGKLIATDGHEKHWDGTNLRERIQDELADMLAACSFVIEKNGLDAGAIHNRTAKKLALFKQWHNEQASKGSDA